MPWGDQTGPEGWGPRTGRALGYCSGYNSPGYTRGVPRGGRGFGRGAGFGRGSGRGRGFGFGRGAGFARGGFVRQAPAYPAPAEAPATASVPASRAYDYNYQYSKEDEVADLKAEKRFIEDEMNAMKDALGKISERLKDIEKKESQKK